MNKYLLGVVTLCYAATGLGFAASREWNWALIWGSYAVANFFFMRELGFIR